MPMADFPGRHEGLESPQDGPTIVLFGAPASTFSKLQGFHVRLAQKALVLVNQCGSYIVAMAWLHAFLVSIGGLTPISSQLGLNHRQQLWLWIWTLLLSWFVLGLVQWLIKRKIASADVAQLNADSAFLKLKSLAFATAYDFFASAGTYAVMYSWAVALLGSANTSTIPMLWLWVALTTLFCSLLVALGDAGYGPLNILKKLEGAQQHELHEQLRFLMTFNMGFVLAFVWESALEITFVKVATKAHIERYGKSMFCLGTLALSATLLGLRQVVAVSQNMRRSAKAAEAERARARRKAAAAAAEKRCEEGAGSGPSTSTPLLPPDERDEEDPDKAQDSSLPLLHRALSLSVDTTTHAVTLLPAVAISFNVAAALMWEAGDAIGLYWGAYCLAVSFAFILCSAAMELALLHRALRLHAMAGCSPEEAIAGLELDSLARPEGSNGLLWYQKNVLVPLATAAAARMEEQSLGRRSTHIQTVAAGASNNSNSGQGAAGGAGTVGTSEAGGSGLGAGPASGSGCGAVNHARSSWLERCSIREMREVVRYIVRPDPGSQVAAVANFDYMQKHVESLNVALAFMAGFAWNSCLSLALTSLPAQIAPPLAHPWVYAAVVSVAAVTVDFVVVRLQMALSSRHGI